MGALTLDVGIARSQRMTAVFVPAADSPKRTLQVGQQEAEEL